MSVELESAKDFLNLHVHRYLSEKIIEDALEKARVDFWKDWRKKVYQDCKIPKCVLPDFVDQDKIEHIKVYTAFITNNCHGKKKDVHGREYREVYEKFGHIKMVNEYLTTNTWLIK